MFVGRSRLSYLRALCVLLLRECGVYIPVSKSRIYGLGYWFWGGRVVGVKWDFGRISSGRVAYGCRYADDGVLADIVLRWEVRGVGYRWFCGEVLLGKVILKVIFYTECTGQMEVW